MIYPPRPESLTPQTGNGQHAPIADGSRQPVVYPVSISVEPKWARMLTRLQELEKTGAKVIVDLEAMTLSVMGKEERLAPKPKNVLSLQK